MNLDPAQRLKISETQKVKGDSFTLLQRSSLTLHGCSEGPRLGFARSLPPPQWRSKPE